MILIVVKTNIIPRGSSIDELLVVRNKLKVLSNHSFRGHLSYQRKT